MGNDIGCWWCLKWGCSMYRVCCWGWVINGGCLVMGGVYYYDGMS